jgi:pSer/pThr/pTyr-binding forkhead associated (FHA) protein
MPATTPPTLDDTDEETGGTVAFGANIKNLKIPSSLLALQIRDHQGHWHFWTHIGAGGMKVGRSDKSARFPELNSMAARHMRIGVEGAKVIVEDLGSLNGVFVKLRGPVELEDGARFRVGSQVVEFRRAEPVEPVEPAVSEDGEVFWSGDLRAPAYLEFFRPDGRPGLRVPLTKPDATVLGREPRSGRPVDIALAGDEMASGQHAAIRREGDRFFLEDLNSRNGTFLRLRGTCEIQVGDELLVGRVLLRVADALRSF